MNFIAIMFSIVDAFSDDGPTPEQAILSQLQQLADLMARFQEENRQRFNRIDRTLAAIFAEMTAQFRVVSTQIESSNFQLDQVRGAIGSLAARIDQMEGQLLNYLQLIANQPFGRDMEKCLGHKQKTGNALGEKEYDSCVFSILSFIDEAKSSALSGVPGGAESMEALALVLKEGDWAENINTLLALSHNKAGFPPFQTLPNPIRWATAADAYATLAFENEEFFRKKPRNSLDRIAREGQLLNVTLSSLAVDDPDRFLFLMKALLSSYQEAAAQITVVARKLRSRALADSGALSSWTTPNELRKVALEYRLHMEKRDIPIVGDWPLVETQKWPTSPPHWRSFVRDPARGAGIPFKPLSRKHHAWSKLSENPMLIAPELLGMGTVHARYFLTCSPFSRQL